MVQISMEPCLQGCLHNELISITLVLFTAMRGHKRIGEHGEILSIIFVLFTATRGLVNGVNLCGTFTTGLSAR